MLSAQSSDAKYIHTVVQPSPPPSHRFPFILRLGLAQEINEMSLEYLVDKDTERKEMPKR